MASLNQKTGILGTRLAKHLLRRTSYNYSSNRIQQIAAMDADTAVDLLSQFKVYQNRPMDPLDTDPGHFDFTTIYKSNTNVNGVGDGQRKKHQVISWWVHEALNDDTITSKMVYLLYTLYPVPPVLTSFDMYEYIRLLHFHSLDNIKDLAYRMSLDTQMNKFLNNFENTKEAPNENYARELLELFTIGKGKPQGPGDYSNYTEVDVVEAARVLTGFNIADRLSEIDPVTGLYRVGVSGGRHDLGDKQFSSAFNNTVITGATSYTDILRELQDLIDMIFDQDETAKYFCRKLYRFFVSDKLTQEIENDIIAPLASDLYSNGYNILPVLKKILKSQHFYDEDDSSNTDEIIGGKMKSPLELITDGLTFLSIPIPDITPSTFPTQDHEDWFLKFARGSFLNYMESTGHYVFNPPSVAGDPAYYQEPGYSKLWFNETTYVARYNLSTDIILEGKRVNGSIGSGGLYPDMIAILTNTSIISDPFDTRTIVDDIVDYLFPEEIDTTRKDYFEHFLTANGTINWASYWQNHINGQTGAQGTADVIVLFQEFLKNIIQSPEYQTF